MLIIPEQGGGGEGKGGEQILCDQTPPGQLEIFQKQLWRMNASSREMVYVNFQNPTCPRDFPGTDFLKNLEKPWNNLEKTLNVLEFENDIFEHNFSSTQLYWEVKPLLESPMTDIWCVKCSG